MPKPSERFRRLRLRLFGDRLISSSSEVLREIREEDGTLSSIGPP